MRTINITINLDDEQKTMAFRLCDTHDCDNFAQFYLLWTDDAYYCPHCASWAMKVGDAMDYDVPNKTLRKMTRTEILPFEENTLEEHTEIIEMFLLRAGLKSLYRKV